MCARTRALKRARAQSRTGAETGVVDKTNRVPTIQYGRPFEMSTKGETWKEAKVLEQDRFCAFKLPIERIVVGQNVRLTDKKATPLPRWRKKSRLNKREPQPRCDVDPATRTPMQLLTVSHHDPNIQPAGHVGLRTVLRAGE